MCTHTISLLINRIQENVIFSRFQFHQEIFGNNAGTRNSIVGYILRNIEHILLISGKQPCSFDPFIIRKFIGKIKVTANVLTIHKDHTAVFFIINNIVVITVHIIPAGAFQTQSHLR